jgi:hypothetical protein
VTDQVTFRIDDEVLAEALDEAEDEHGSRSEALREAIRHTYLDNPEMLGDLDSSPLPKAAREGYAALREHADVGVRLGIDAAESIIAQRVQLRKETVRSTVIHKLHAAGWIAVEQGVRQVAVVIRPRTAADGGRNADDQDDDVLNDRDTDDVDIDAEFARLESAKIDRGDGIETDGGEDQESTASFQRRMETLRAVHTESIDTDEECQTMFGRTKEEAEPCGVDAAYQIEVKNEFGDEFTMKVCPACKVAWEERGNVELDRGDGVETDGGTTAAGDLLQVITDRDPAEMDHRELYREWHEAAEGARKAADADVQQQLHDRRRDTPRLSPTP